MRVQVCLALALCAAAAVYALPTDVLSQPREETELRYICFGPTDCRMMTLHDAFKHKEEAGKDCNDFIDFTAHRSLQTAPVNRRVRAFPAGPTHQAQVKPLLNELSKDNLRANVEQLSSGKNRYYTSATGVASMEWVLQQFQNMPGVDAYFFQHSDFRQPSVIGRINGTSSDVIVVGAHGDSIAGRGADPVAPGADDDASGVANLLEAARVISNHLSKANITPTRTIEFMVYAAEEVGLLGSLDIAEDYQNRGVNVFAAYQIEMSGYNAHAHKASEAGPTVALITDYVDKSLTSFTKSLVTEYLSIPAREIRCGYGCSDHASWFQTDVAGVCAAEAGPFDTNLNPYMHTTGDVSAELDYDQCLEFAKLALAFSVELSL